MEAQGCLSGSLAGWAECCAVSSWVAVGASTGYSSSSAEQPGVTSQSPAHPPKCCHSPGRRFPPCLPGIAVCASMGRRKNMMGNWKIKIIPVKIGCWKAGKELGLCKVAVCRRLLGPGRLSGCLGQNTQFYTRALRQRQHSSVGSRLVSCVPQNMTDYGYFHQCVHSPSLNTCLNSFLLGEGHKPFPTAHQPGITFI